MSALTAFFPQDWSGGRYRGTPIRASASAKRSAPMRGTLDVVLLSPLCRPVLTRPANVVNKPKTMPAAVTASTAKSGQFGTVR